MSNIICIILLVYSINHKCHDNPDFKISFMSYVFNNTLVKMSLTAWSSSCNMCCESLKIKISEISHDICSYCGVPPKHWHPLTRLYSVKTQKIAMWIFTATKTSDLMKYYFSKLSWYFLVPIFLGHNKEINAFLWLYRGLLYVL